MKKSSGSILRHRTRLNLPRSHVTASYPWPKFHPCPIDARAKPFTAAERLSSRDTDSDNDAPYRGPRANIGRSCSFPPSVRRAPHGAPERASANRKAGIRTDQNQGRWFRLEAQLRRVWVRKGGEIDKAKYQSATTVLVGKELYIRAIISP